MISLRKFRNFDLNPQEGSSSLRYFKKQNVDFDVYLPTKGLNLQRDLVWTIEQKRELIMSILMGRHVPHMAFVNIVLHNEKDYKDMFQVIDGKQRITTMFDFYDDKFTIELEGKEYLFSELPDEYQRAISHYHFRYYIINEPFEKPMTDDEKISWFKFLNFAGTPQDKEHMKKFI
jgi:hypothetical protein